MTDWLRKYLTPVYQPATEGEGEGAIVDPPAVVEGAAGDPPTEGEVSAEVTPQAEPAKTTPWFLKRISEESAKAHQESQRAATAERARDEAIALAQRLQAGKEPPAKIDAPAPSADDFQTQVQQAATRQRLHEDIAMVAREGERKLGQDFTNAVNIVRALGATTDEFLADVLAVDKENAPNILHALAQDPEKTGNLVGMDSRRRIAELTRMSVAINAVASAEVAPKVVAKQVSKAPAPPPKVDPSASKVIDWRADDASDADFDVGFNEMMAKRRARR